MDLKTASRCVRGSVNWIAVWCWAGGADNTWLAGEKVKTHVLLFLLPPLPISHFFQAGAPNSLSVLEFGKCYKHPYFLQLPSSPLFSNSLSRELRMPRR